MRNGLLLSLLMAVSMPAMAIYKCESQGHVTYTDVPCGATRTALPPAPLPADAAGASQRATSERQQLAAIAKSQEAERLRSEREQRRHKQDKTELAHKRNAQCLRSKKNGLLKTRRPDRTRFP